MTTATATAAALAPASDVGVLHRVATTVATPKEAAADSFILHAPLEVLARTALLGFVDPADRDAVRDRLRWVGQQYADAGPSVDPPPARSWDEPGRTVAALTGAVGAGELDDADAAASWLARALPAEELQAALADVVVPSLAAAAHGAIFLYQLPRVAPRSSAAAQMLRGLVRELARHPDWRLTWMDERSDTPGAEVGRGELVDRLLAPTAPDDPGSDFIFPTMAATESGGFAAGTLDAPLRHATVRSARRDLLRVAAHSMLQDAPDAAPYGWSHCLTMPQATLGIAGASADPERAVAVAATYVLGFRSMLRTTPFDPAWVPDAPAEPTFDGLDGPPDVAAAAAWHARPDELGELWRTLATRAALHEDAHLAKYTLACLDATRADQDAAPLFRAAAAFLGAWWRALAG